MILLTGASGFIGKHLLVALHREYGVSNILALTSKPISECLYLLHNNYNFDNDYFVKTGFASEVTTIIHAGAFIPKDGKQANDWQKCNSNISSTDKLLRADLPNLKKIIYLSTVDVYDKDDLISEQSPVKPVSLYADSKYYAEKMMMSCTNSENKTCQVLRVGHVYGPGEEAYQKVIPITISKLLKEQPVQIWGTGNELRSFIYIDDVVKAILSSLKLEISISPVNIAGSQAISVKELIAKLIFISGKKPKIEMVPSSVLSRNLVFDNTKMRKYLTFSETPLDEGLLVEWRYMKQIAG